MREEKGARHFQLFPGEFRHKSVMHDRTEQVTKVNIYTCLSQICPLERKQGQGVSRHNGKTWEEWVGITPQLKASVPGKCGNSGLYLDYCQRRNTARAMIREVPLVKLN